MPYVTPSHFLTGDVVTSIPENSSINNVEPTILKRWELLQQMKQGFWKGYYKEHLNSLQQRHKWKERIPNLSIGDLLLVKEDYMLPGVWPLGRLSEIHPGKDGNVRVATVRTVNALEIDIKSSRLQFIDAGMGVQTGMSFDPWHDGVRRSLQSPYQGPYKVLSKSDKLFKLLINRKSSFINVDRLKPAFLASEDEPPIAVGKKQEPVTTTTRCKTILETGGASLPMAPNPSIKAKEEREESHSEEPFQSSNYDVVHYSSVPLMPFRRGSHNHLAVPPGFPQSSATKFGQPVSFSLGLPYLKRLFSRRWSPFSRTYANVVSKAVDNSLPGQGVLNRGPREVPLPPPLPVLSHTAGIPRKPLQLRNQHPRVQAAARHSVEGVASASQKAARSGAQRPLPPPPHNIRSGSQAARPVRKQALPRKQNASFIRQGILCSLAPPKFFLQLPLFGQFPLSFGNVLFN
ncbi:hypothetical protein HNY73_023248 [Argiope bruennichi]|uniref:DUF5641 domain-containing protein n=1 Tax=Argiope bruennichi TaxID=94029 RepID=A0A8T0E4T7_ARGBR|nr:hypothetical protein HNY73_023248 [Argiope bruennichi]